MRWIIVTGILQNFIMYAVAAFVTPYTMRFHHMDVQYAGWISMAVYGLAGVPGMIVGGLLGDAVMRRVSNGRLLVAGTAMLLAAPMFYFALWQPAGAVFFFGLLFGLGCMMLYTYYATVYSAIQDVIEPSLRATAMAIYFCAMYALGGGSARR